MLQRLKQLNPVLSDLCVLDICYLIIGELIILLFLPNKIFYGVGFLSGVAYSVFASIHMSITLKDLMYLDSNGAVKKSLFSYGIRLVIVAAMLILLYYTQMGDVFCSFLGMLSLKVSAYIQPFTHNLFQKLGKGR